MALRYTEDGARRLMQRLHEEAEVRRSVAGRLYPTKVEKQGPVHGWGKASESVHRARGPVSPLGGKAK
jgi:hypothetical protein